MNNAERQKLIDITFQIASATKLEKSIRDLPHEQYMEWVAKQLRLCGYDTTPVGASWGVLKYYKYE